MGSRQNVRFARVEDTTWPVYDGSAEWALRYGGEGLLTRSDKLYLASVLSAYEHLTDPRRTVHEVGDALRRARKARAGS